MQQIRTDPAGLQLAASHGDPIATFLLAAIVSSPEGGGDLKEGTRLMRRAADMGMPAAMANLGILYLRGQGVPQDYVLGYVWLARAVAAGLDDAIELRDALASRLSPEQIAEAQTLAAK